MCANMRHSQDQNDHGWEDALNVISDVCDSTEVCNALTTCNMQQEEEEEGAL
jgi:hypothetical protein